MDANKIIKGLDELFEKNRLGEIEGYLAENMVKAMQEGDSACLLVLINEMVGFLRDSNRYEDSLTYAQKALDIIESEGLSGTVHHATTLVNYGNALRAAGRLETSIEAYTAAEKIFAKVLPADAFDFASLNNNLSLVYMEMREFDKAVECLMKALAIAEKTPGKGFELGVTWTNLGNSILATGTDDEKALSYLQKAVDYFSSENIFDTHYGAAVMGIGDVYEKRGQLALAAREYEKALVAISQNFGFTDFYYRIQERSQLVSRKMQDNGLEAGYSGKGLDVCRRYYEEVLSPEFGDKIPELKGRYAAGLSGMGSECFGMDDVVSRDHDWGPAVCIWVSDSEWDDCHEKLEEAYSSLPEKFEGYSRITSDKGSGRVGVINLKKYACQILGDRFGALLYEAAEHGLSVKQQRGNREYDTLLLSVPESALAAFVNGEIFDAGDGLLSSMREMIEGGYPMHLRCLKMAQAAALFSQTLQYNVRRMAVRRDLRSVRLAVDSGVRKIYELIYLANGWYMPHEKWIPGWLEKALDEKEDTAGADIFSYVDKIYEEAEALIVQAKKGENVTERVLAGYNRAVSDTADYILAEYRRSGLLTEGWMQVKGNYLEDIAEELALRAGFWDLDKDTLVENIVRMEWAAFDKVQNEGGRASCQDNWGTFSIMRKSQYRCFSEEMLVQFSTDFALSQKSGWNPITEKYGRMEESTAPEKWNEIRDQFPYVSDEKKSIIEGIVKIQVGWMEEFASKYPNMAGNARSIHTSEDNEYNTSFETYLRGEISTYSDSMLSLYGAFIVEIARRGGNLSRDTMEQTALLYGYESLDKAEEKLS